MSYRYDYDMIAKVLEKIKSIPIAPNAINDVLKHNGHSQAKKLLSLLDKDYFCMSHYQLHSRKTCGCVAGWTCFLVNGPDERESHFHNASLILGIEQKEAILLFHAVAKQKEPEQLAIKILEAILSDRKTTITEQYYKLTVQQSTQQVELIEMTH